MKLLRTLLMSFLALGLMAPASFAAGNAAKGKALFNNPKAFGGSTSCNFCHPGGKGLEDAGMQKEWSTPAGKTRTLEEAINLCIVNANRGKALDVKSAQMADIVAYIKSLGKKKKK